MSGAKTGTRQGSRGPESRKQGSRGPNLPLVGAPCLFILGGVLMGLAVLHGQAEVGILLIFPFIVGGGWLTGLGIIMIILGFVALMVGMTRRMVMVSPGEGAGGRDRGISRSRTRDGPRRVGDQEVETASVFGNMKGGGVIFIGPVPIVFGSDTKVTKLMLYLGIVLVIGLCLFFFALGFLDI